MTETMSLQRLQALLDRYGAAPERWPAAERNAAASLIANAPEARKMQQDAARLDNLLDSVEPPAPAPGLVAKIAEIGATPPRKGFMARLRAAWLGGPVFTHPAARPAAFAAVGLFGLLIGAALPRGEVPWDASVSAPVSAPVSALVDSRAAPATERLAAPPTWDEPENAGDADAGDAPDTTTEITEDGIGEIAALDLVPLI